MEEIKENIKQALSKYGIVGLIIALVISAVLTVIGWILSLFAAKTDDEASKIRNEALALHDSELESLNTILEKLGKEKLEAIDSFDRFIVAYETIKNRPEGLASKFEKVKLPKLEVEDIKKLRAGTQALLAQGGGVAVGCGLGIAAFGINVFALAPAALAGGVAVCIKGASLKSKAAKNKKEALKLREETFKIVEYYRDLGRVSNDLFGCFILVKHQYLEHLDKFCLLVKSNPNWRTYSYSDKTLIKNTILLVKIISDLCNVNLINKPKTANGIETVNEKEVSLAMDESYKALATIG